MKISQAIKYYRLNQGLTQKDLSIKIDKSIRCVKRYEKGEIVPSIKILECIFDKPIEDILYNNLTTGE